ncbi:hypothetical protein Riv7116_1802 [Rivularia sp. PCC 7116]|nr:hypothetical protein Riv7116_1802 [Rivularia sp. PCC 7116]
MSFIWEKISCDVLNINLFEHKQHPEDDEIAVFPIKP